MKLESWQPLETKRRWKLVRTEDYMDVKCNAIITADESTGECRIEVNGENIARSYGPNGIRILPR